MKMRWSATSLILSLCVIWLALLACAPAHGQAYCYIRDVKYDLLSNGVQLKIKADGILTWNWEPGSEPAGWGEDMSQVSIRFPSARIGVDKTLYDIDEIPVSTASLLVPQDAKDGRGVVLNITMTEPSQVSASLSEDRQMFLLTVSSKHTVERINRANGAAAIKVGTFEVTEANGLISVKAVKASIHQVVAEIARKSGICVAVDDAVKHDISLNLLDRKPLDVINGIAAGYGLALSAVSGVYMLSEGVPADLPTYRRSGTASFPMKYLKAGDAKSLLPSFLFKYVHDNPQQNAVVVTAPSQMLNKIRTDLAAIDVPPAMVLIEAAVVELTESKDLDSGFHWQYQDGNHAAGADSGTGDISFHQTGLATTIVPTPQLQAWLQALITKGRAEVQAHPSLAAVNGKSSELFIGSQRFIKMTVMEYGATQERIETVPVGVRLVINPLTNGTQEITVGVTVEVSNIVQVDPKTGIPRLSRRTIGTTVRTLDGDTIIIGGLGQKQEENTQRHVPLLGHIPFIGSLFRSKSQGSSNTELVILLRPRLLDPSGRLPAAEDRNIRQKFLEQDDLGCPTAEELKGAAETAPARPK